ncbi:MAG: hypothetical protein QM773_14280 [Hyphomonadaceae bacterium]
MSKAELSRGNDVKAAENRPGEAKLVIFNTPMHLWAREHAPPRRYTRDLSLLADANRNNVVDVQVRNLRGCSG